MKKRKYVTKAEKLKWVLEHGSLSMTTIKNLFLECKSPQELEELSEYRDKGYYKYSFVPFENYSDAFGCTKIVQYSKNPFTLINVLYGEK